VPARYLQCEGCGELLVDPKDSTAASQRAADQVRREEGLLTSAEIIAVRNKLGLTQREFERLLRVGKNTVVRWEAGTVVQNPALDDKIRGLRDVPEFADYLAQRHAVKIKGRINIEANVVMAISFRPSPRDIDLEAWAEVITEETERTVKTRRIVTSRVRGGVFARKAS
jgi:putative zinc finger/helix-turn-helix YgiT family protein